MRPDALDSDWMIPTEPTTYAERTRNALLCNPGCFLQDAPEDATVWFSALKDAIELPPMTPESVIRDGAGRCLAMTSDEDARWTLTMLGRQVVEMQAYAPRRGS